MLEYRRPGPSPGGRWWSRRSQELWERRAPDNGPIIAVGHEQLLARSAAGTVSVRVFAGSATVTVQLNVRMRDPRPPAPFWEEYECPEVLPDTFLRVGVRFSDGRVATNLPGAFWTAADEGPLFLTGFERGDLADELPEWSRSVDALRWILWPIPPPGPVTVACAWPARGISEWSVVFDGDAIRAAAETSAAQARERPADPEPEPTEPPWWANRSDTDEPIAWSITAWLSPGNPVMSRETWDPLVERIAEQAQVQQWDGDELDGSLREYEAARREAAPATDFGWMSFHRHAYRLELTEVAATETAAREQAEKRFTVPEGWSLSLDVEPAP